MENKILCPNCNTPNDVNAHQCFLCSFDLKSSNSNIVTCPNCNSNNPDYAYNCLECGCLLKLLPPEDIIEPNRKRKKLNKLLTLLVVISFSSVFYFTTIKHNEVNIIKSATVKVATSSNPQANSTQVNSKSTQTLNSLSNCSTDDSSISFKLNLSSDIQRVWFKIVKGTDERNQVVNVTNGVLATKIYLPFNKGEYNISVLTNNSKDPNQTLFYPLKEFKAMNNDNRDMQFLLPDQFVESDSPEIINLANAIIEGSKSDMEKTTAIHDWVVCNIAYDAEEYFAGNIHEYSALETLHGKKAICNGYANLTAALNRAVGIRTKIASGDAKDSNGSYGHAWNETYIDGKWVIQDTTWDAGGLNTITKKFVLNPTRDYFNPSAEKFAITHTKDSER